MKTKTKNLLGLCSLGLMVAFALTVSPINGVSADAACLGSGANCNTATTVLMTVLPGDVCIGSSGSFNFGSYTISSTIQTVNGAFAGTGGYFYVDDLKGADNGYYTTVQMSGVLAGPGGASIPAANIAMKTPSVGAAGITLLAGTANTRVQIQSAMVAYQTLDAPRQLIIRTNAANFGVVGKYGVLPQMQLTIPAYQQVGSYTGTLVYTLYPN